MAYLDTSALLKWYVPEAGSEQFDNWIASQEEVEISRLTCLEMRSTLARKVRTSQLNHQQAQQALNHFLEDVNNGLFTLYAVRDEDWLIAENLIDTLTTLAAPIPLRSLDALHLAVTQSRQITSIATADQVLGNAAGKIGIQSILF